MRKPIQSTAGVQWLAVVALTLFSFGCTGKSADSVPQFQLAWSEYPSWSVFGVADQRGLVDGAAGKMGPIEKKWNVDIVLKQADYVPCLSFYASKAVDAVCVANIDALSPALARKSVAILPTSHSYGADACIVVGVADVKSLAKVKVYGLEASVSEYCFIRNLEVLGENPDDFQFVNRDPAAAATAMETNPQETKAIVVWNPFVMQTLKNNPDAQVLFDSRTIEEEILDLVVMGQDALEKPGGPEFASAVADMFYQVNELLAAPATQDATLQAIGAKFSDLTASEMKTVLDQTRMYGTRDAAQQLYDSTKLKEKMGVVVDFCVRNGNVESAPSLGFGGDSGDLTFRSEYFLREKP